MDHRWWMLTVRKVLEHSTGGWLGSTVDWWDPAEIRWIVTFPPCWVKSASLFGVVYVLTTVTWTVKIAVFERVCVCTVFTVITTKMKQEPFLISNRLVNSWKEQHNVHCIVHRSSEQSIMQCHVAVRVLSSLHQETDADATQQPVLFLILRQNLTVVLDQCYSMFSEVVGSSNLRITCCDDWKEA